MPYERLKIFVCLSRKTDDDIRADRRVRNAGADAVDERCVLLDRVRASHRRQHAIARVLQWQMEVWCELFRTSDELDDLARAVHWFERADAEDNFSRAREST